MLKIVHGNIFDSPAQALVNPVNCVGVMGKGLALAFKQRYLANFYAYRDACYRRQLKIGHVHVFQCSDYFRDQFIINFPTKDHWRNPSELQFIEAGLQSLTCAILHYQIDSIAIPALGVGLGNLCWEDVLPLIQAEAETWTCETFLFKPH